MAYFSNHAPITTLLLILIGCSCFSSISKAAEYDAPDYELSLSFAPQMGQLIGTAKITIAPDRRIALFLQELEITGTLLKDESGREHELLPTKDVLILPSAKKHRILYLSYTKTIKNDFDNLISPEGISLNSNWYPLPEQPMRFKLTATLPDHFSAITEADIFPLRQEGNSITASFSKAVTNIHFNAGPYYLEKLQVREGLFVYSMFFEEDKELASGYLQAAADYLRKYEKEIGPYPYNHYVIVANRLPTGYGMPTFTLLGQMVLRLPFIKNTSLGHEIVHSWFGNAVEVNYSQGNWCEGLTSFLADHAYREIKNEGLANRTESITRYHSYVHKESAISLMAFTSASHNQPMAEARRAVGYNKGALFFHELRLKIGNQAFNMGLRQFYADNTGKRASWADLQKSFEIASGADLETFFTERLTRNFIPKLKVEDIEVEYTEGNSILSFSLLQQSEEPFSLIVPIQIKTMSAIINKKIEIHEKKTRISIPLNQRPLEFTIDPQHDFLRQLADEERPPVWSRFLGSSKTLVILSKESDRDLYQPLIDALGKKELNLTTAEEVSNLEMSENDLLFLGTDQAPARALFGPPKLLEEGFSLDVRHNPLNRSHVAVLISSSKKEQTMNVARRLSHYGKYSYLEFKHGRNVKKTVRSSSPGLRFVLEKLPVGGKSSKLSSFEQIMDKLAENRVIYVGETHTSLADHLLQLRIIEALHKKDPNLAIGMEMFPVSSQPALDRYTLSSAEVDEKTFLKESDYYNVWRFDYRFFQDIFRFARNKGIPVIGLNLERKIVSEVFRSGGTDSLDKEVLKSLPQDRNLDMEGYSERLSFMHNIHMQGSHGSGAESGFIQAQGLWDESMAENIATFLTKRPDYKMVVLAGSQHTRKDSGIPPRVARRIPIQQASVLNIYNNSFPANLSDIADYYFLAAPAELPESPKIGIVLTTHQENDQMFQKISQLSPHGKAAASGLQEADILLEVNGYPISDMADLRIAMLGTSAGDIIEIKVSREKDNDDIELLFKVELTTPPTSQPHP